MESLVLGVLVAEREYLEGGSVIVDGSIVQRVGLIRRWRVGLVVVRHRLEACLVVSMECLSDGVLTSDLKVKR